MKRIVSYLLGAVIGLVSVVFLPIDILTKVGIGLTVAASAGFGIDKYLSS